MKEPSYPMNGRQCGPKNGSGRFGKESNFLPLRELGPGWLSRYSDSLRAGRSGDRIPVVGENFRTCSVRNWGPPNLLYSLYRVFPGGKVVGTWRWPSTPSSAEVEGRVELYICSPSVPSWPVLYWTLPLHLPLPYENSNHVPSNPKPRRYNCSRYYIFYAYSEIF